MSANSLEVGAIEKSPTYEQAKIRAFCHLDRSREECIEAGKMASEWVNQRHVAPEAQRSSQCQSPAKAIVHTFRMVKFRLLSEDAFLAEPETGHVKSVEAKCLPIAFSAT